MLAGDGETGGQRLGELKEALAVQGFVEDEIDLVQGLPCGAGGGWALEEFRNDPGVRPMLTELVLVARVDLDLRR